MGTRTARVLGRDARVVTLAAAIVLPKETPARDALVLAAVAVVAGTLLLQGTTLPWLFRRLDLPGPDPAEDALQEAALLSTATRAGLNRLEELRDEGAMTQQLSIVSRSASALAPTAPGNVSAAGAHRARRPARPTAGCV